MKNTVCRSLQNRRGQPIIEVMDAIGHGPTDALKPAVRPLSPALLRPRRSRWAAMAAPLLALLGAYAIWQLCGWPQGHRELIGDVFSYPFDLAAAGAAWAASRRCSADPRLRSAWRLLSLALASNLLGDVIWTVYELVGSQPYPSAADGFYLLFYPLMLWGVLRFAADSPSIAERARLGLDLAIVAIGGLVVVIYVYLGPTITEGGSSALERTVSIAYPVGDAVLLVGLASVLVRRGAPSSVRALQFTAAGVLCFIIADLIYGYITLHGTYAGGNPNDSLYLIAMALLAIAGTLQAAPAASVAAIHDRGRRRAAWAPYAAIGIALAVLLVIRRRDPLLPDLAVLAAAVVLVILVSVRQYLAQRDLVRAQRRLSHQSLHDTLTGLPNRALVMDRAEQMLARARRESARVAALYVDIDNFKHVNDNFGHAVGDEVLRAVAARLTSVIRDADTVGRIGGDEFVVLLDNLTLDVGPELAAERICQALAQPVELRDADPHTISVTATVGIATGPRGSVDELLRDADYALYEAKASGKNRVLTFESRMQTAAQDRIALELDLKEALQQEQFFLLYQPTFELQSETVTGVEALIRWRHPRRGIVAPNAFIPVAEESGLIVPIGRWVLYAACRQAAAWRRAGSELGMSVNVSARQLDQYSLVDDVRGALDLTGLDPSALTLEITETSLMTNPDASAHTLRALKSIGVRVAIDDFGTGYSSLAYLRQFPVDALKIDRSFISAIATSREAKALIHMLIQLGKTLGLQTLGEGIEERDQLRHLQSEHCDAGQGFLFARPLEPHAIQHLLEQSSPPTYTA